MLLCPRKPGGNSFGEVLRYDVGMSLNSAATVALHVCPERGHVARLRRSTLRKPIIKPPRFSPGGCFWGVDAVFKTRQGRAAGGVGICRRQAGHRALRDGGNGRTGHAESVQVTYDPYADLVRQTAAGVFRRGPRSHATQSARPRRGHAVSLRHFLASDDQKGWPRRTSASWKRRALSSTRS